MAKIQGGYINLIAMDHYGYGTGEGVFRGTVNDLFISTNYDSDYLIEVLKDHIYMRELADALTIQVAAGGGVVDFEGRKECLAKIDTLRNKMKAKHSQIDLILIASTVLFPRSNSVFNKGTLFLHCADSAAEMSAVVDAIEK